MSWSASASSQKPDSWREGVAASFYPQQDAETESRAQFEAACDVADTLIGFLGEGVELLSVTLSGHVHTPGTARSAVSVSLNDQTSRED